MIDPTFGDVDALSGMVYYCGTYIRTFRVVNLKDLHAHMSSRYPDMDLEQFQTLTRFMFLSGLVAIDRPTALQRKIRWIGPAIDPQVTVHLFMMDVRSPGAPIAGIVHARCTLCGRIDSDPIHLT